MERFSRESEGKCSKFLFNDVIWRVKKELALSIKSILISYLEDLVLLSSLLQYTIHFCQPS